MDAETINAIANALSGPSSALFVMFAIIAGAYKIASNLLGPFLHSVAESIKTGFQEQSTALSKLVDEIKIDREVQKGIGSKVELLEKDVSEIKLDVSDIKDLIRK